MPQDLPPSGGYEPVQYKVSESISSVIASQMADSGASFRKTAQPPCARVSAGILPRCHGRDHDVRTL